MRIISFLREDNGEILFVAKVFRGNITRLKVYSKYNYAKEFMRGNSGTKYSVGNKRKFINLVG